jgi:hypothetical protein
MGLQLISDELRLSSFFFLSKFVFPFAFSLQGSPIKVPCREQQKGKENLEKGKRKKESINSSEIGAAERGPCEHICLGRRGQAHLLVFQHGLRSSDSSVDGGKPTC